MKKNTRSPCHDKNNFDEALRCYQRLTGNYGVATSIICKYRREIDKEGRCKRPRSGYFQKSGTKMNHAVRAPVILMDGFPGVGKTTLAHSLAKSHPDHVEAIDSDIFTQRVIHSFPDMSRCRDSRQYFREKAIKPLREAIESVAPQKIVIVAGITNFVVDENCTEQILRGATISSRPVTRVWLRPAGPPKDEIAETYKRQVLRWLRTPAYKWMTREGDPWGDVKPPAAPLSDREFRRATALTPAEFSADPRYTHLMLKMHESLSSYGGLRNDKMQTLATGKWTQMTDHEVKKRVQTMLTSQSPKKLRSRITKSLSDNDDSDEDYYLRRDFKPLETSSSSDDEDFEINESEILKRAEEKKKREASARLAEERENERVVAQLIADTGKKMEEEKREQHEARAKALAKERAAALKREERTERLSNLEISLKNQGRKTTTAKDMLGDLMSAMGDFQADNPLQKNFDAAYYFARSIQLACLRILAFDRSVWDDTAEEANVFTDQNFKHNLRIRKLTRILKTFTPLASIWGYNHTGHNHKNFEDRIHKDSSIYGCIYPTTDVVFRNLARIAANGKLIISDAVQGTTGKSKWRDENFDLCFDEKGDKVRKLLDEFKGVAIDPSPKSKK